MNRHLRHTMEFKSFPDLSDFQNPTTLVAHRLTRADLQRYDKAKGCFRLQHLRFHYSDIIPKVGDFIVRFADDEAHPVPTGVVVLVGAGRFFEITGDKKALDSLGTMEDKASCS